MSGLQGQSVPIDQVPVLHVRGTNYQVGFSIGRTFAGMITEYTNEWKHFSEVLKPAYETNRGRKIYDTTLQTCKSRYPQYVEEMRGIADGAGFPFHEIFLLHIEALLEEQPLDKESSLGCTSVISNVENTILGHTEDAPTEMLNRFFIVSAQIVNESGEVLEDYATLTYPGYLPGYTMGFNRHGLVYSVNTIYPLKTYAGRTPVYFITRALLSAKTTDEVISILKDTGAGIADGFTLNLIMRREGVDEPDVANIEVGPNRENIPESELSIHWVSKGTSFVHCNRYLRLDHPEILGASYRSSCHRHNVISKLPSPNTVALVEDILSDQSDTNFPVYRTDTPEQLSDENTDGGRDYACTVATGIFDILKKTWSIYTNPPASSDPVVVLPLNFKL